MDEDDPVRFPLLEVGGRDAEADPEPNDRKHCGRAGEPRRESTRKRIELSRRRKLVEVHQSSAIRTAAAVASGAPTSAISKPATSNEKCADVDNPARIASAAPAPKISTGT